MDTIILLLNNLNEISKRIKAIFHIMLFTTIYVSAPELITEIFM